MRARNENNNVSTPKHGSRSRVGREEAQKKEEKEGGKKDACYHKVKSRYDVWPLLMLRVLW